MTLIFSIIFLLYFILVIGLIVGWGRSARQRPIDDGRAHVEIENFITVIIPARNEANAISAIIDNLKAQTYRAFEVLIIDDHSDDCTIERSITCAGGDNRFKIIQSFGTGKKEAIALGVQRAQGTIIVTTDADCRVGEHWLAVINTYFQDQKAKLTFGPVRIEDKNAFTASMQAIEFGSLIGSGAATLALGFPSMCNGANLAYRKDAFAAVEGYRDNLHVPSGDDEFLLRKIFNEYPGSIRFMHQRQAIVSTAPQTSVSGFINQRIRWAGKWSFQTLNSRLLSLFIFTFHLSAIMATVFVFTGKINLAAFVIIFSAKTIVEFVFLFRISSFLQNKWRWSVFILLALFYPLYVVFIGILSNFQTFSWKGRTHKSIRAKFDDVSRYPLNLW